VGAESVRFGPPVRALLPTLPELLRGAEATAATDRAAELVGQGVPAPLARRAAALLHAPGLLDVIEAGAQAGPLPLDQVARLYFALSERWSATARR
jgi:glutamate dehydrogenase